MTHRQPNICGIVFTVTLLALCCDRSSSPNIDKLGDPSLPVFARNSSWQLDSIGKIEPFFDLGATWGTSPSDVYAVGSKILHFDGLKWNMVPFDKSLGGPVESPYGLFDIFGFSSSDFYVVGSKMYGSSHTPLVVHYERGVGNLVYFKTLYFGDPLMCIWGSNPNNVWVGGGHGLILHYDGQSWTQEQINFRFTSSEYWHVSDIAGNSSSSPYALIFLASSTVPYEVRYLLKRVGNSWNLIDSTSSSSIQCNKLYVSPTNTLYSAGRHLAKWNDAAWNVVKLGTDSRSIVQVVANSDANLFVVGGSVWGGSGFVEHFDGSTWADVGRSLPSNIALSNGFTDGSCLTALGWDLNAQPYIFRSLPK